MDSNFSKVLDTLIEIAEQGNTDMQIRLARHLTIWGYPVIWADDGSWGYGLNKWDCTKKSYVHKKETEKK